MRSGVGYPTIEIDEDSASVPPGPTSKCGDPAGSSIVFWRGGNAPFDVVRATTSASALAAVLSIRGGCEAATWGRGNRNACVGVLCSRP